jgi:hypothetical protein
MIIPGGGTVRVAFQPHELEWLAAALTLPLKERKAAFRQIADMSGRELKTVQRRAERLKADKRQEARDFLQAFLTRTWLAGNVRNRVLVPNGMRDWKKLPPSEIAPPDKRKLMGAR